MSEQQQFPQAPPPAQYAPPAKNGLGTAGFVTGLIGAIFGLIPLTAWVALILGILGTVFGAIGRSRATKGQATNKGLATAGLVLGVIAIILAIIGFVILNNALTELSNQLNNS